MFAAKPWLRFPPGKTGTSIFVGYDKPGKGGQSLVGDPFLQLDDEMVNPLVGRRQMPGQPSVVEGQERIGRLSKRPDDSIPMGYIWAAPFHARIPPAVPKFH